MDSHDKRYRVKNWERFQHYKNRRPPWIKLYCELVDDPEYHKLSGEAAKYLILIWVVASEDPGKKGELPCLDKLSFKLRLDKTKLLKIINELSHWIAGCYQDASNTLANCYQLAPPETEGETETEGESNLKKNNIYNMRVENSKGQDNENKNDSRIGQDIEDDSRIGQVDVISKKILLHWPDYPEENARVIAARFIHQYGDLDILDVLDKAWTAWEPNRTIYDRSGLSGYLAAWLNNTKARQPANGQQNTENNQTSTILTQLQNLERKISNDEMIELQNVSELIAECKEDKIKIPNYIRNFLYELHKKNIIDFEHGKIQSFTIRDPCKPSELRKGGPQYLGADEISKMLADKFSLATIGKNTGGAKCK